MRGEEVDGCKVKCKVQVQEQVQGPRHTDKRNCSKVAVSS